MDARNIYLVSDQPHQRSMFWLLNHEKSHFDPEFPVVCEQHVGRFYDDFIKIFEATEVRQNHLHKAKKSISEFGDMCVFGNACIS